MSAYLRRASRAVGAYKRPLTPPTWERKPIVRMHMLLLWLSVIAIIWTYPASAGPVLLLAAAGVVSELSPQHWRRFFLSEGMLLIMGVFSFFWAQTTDQHMEDAHQHVRLEAFSGWTRMVVLYWLLIPCRIGMVRWLTLVIGGELLVASASGFYHPRDSLGGVPLLSWVGPLENPLRVLLSYPICGAFIQAGIAILALASDSWLRIACARRDHVQTSRLHTGSIWRWILVPSLVSILCGLAIGGCIYHWNLAPEPVIQPQPIEENNSNSNNLRLDRSMHIGDHRWVTKNPDILASMDFEGDSPGIQAVYLRTVALPELEIDGPGISWTTGSSSTRFLGDQPSLHNRHQAQLCSIRAFPAALVKNQIPIPDGSCRLALDRVHTDLHGNLYRPGFGELQRRYNCDRGADAYPADANVVRQERLLLHVPSGLAGILMRIPQVEQWRQMKAQDAADSITQFLHTRCSYAIDNLPLESEVPQVAGGVIRTFLFDADANNRRGHCQHFASAFTLLMRVSKHQTRCVAGLASTEHSSEKVEANTLHHTTFRALNAHAWTEFLFIENGRYIWQRYDPTPTSAFTVRPPPPTETTDPLEPEEPTEAITQEAKRPFPFALCGIIVLCGLAMLFILKRRSPKDHRRQTLDRRSEDLIRAAMSLGIPVDRHTTLTQIVTALEEHSGLNLQAPLQAHLAARFAGGPLPEAWPISEILKKANDGKGEQSP